MKIVEICKVCNGVGKLDRKLPLFKKNCPLCQGSGTYTQSLSDYRS